EPQSGVKMQPRAQALGEWSRDESTLKEKKENCGTRAGGPCGVCAIAELETTMQKRTAIVNGIPQTRRRAAAIRTPLFRPSLAPGPVIGNVLFERIQFVAEIVDPLLQQVADGQHAQQLARIIHHRQMAKMPFEHGSQGLARPDVDGRQLNR